MFFYSFACNMRSMHGILKLLCFISALLPCLVEVWSLFFYVVNDLDDVSSSFMHCLIVMSCCVMLSWHFGLDPVQRVYSHNVHVETVRKLPNTKTIKLIGHGSCNPMRKLVVAFGPSWPDCQIAR